MSDPSSTPEPVVNRPLESPPKRRIQQVPIDAITLGDRLRPVVDDDGLERLQAAIADIGQHTPIIVRSLDGEGKGLQLIAGAHRLAAQKKRGTSEIECVVLEGCSDEDARLIEISENLHRKELTALERDHLIAEWVRIVGARRVSCQAEKKLPGRPRGGVSEAARHAGVSITDAHRAVKVNSLTADAKVTAKEVGLDDDRSALLAAARKKPEDQPGTLRQIALAKARGSTGEQGLTADPKAAWLEKGLEWWKAAPPDWQEAFLAQVRVRSSVALPVAGVPAGAVEDRKSSKPPTVTIASATIIHAFRRRARLRLTDLPGAARGVNYSGAVAGLEVEGLVLRQGDELVWTGPR